MYYRGDNTRTLLQHSVGLVSSNETRKRKLKTPHAFAGKHLSIIWHRRKWLKRCIEILLELHRSCIEKCSKVIHNPIHVLYTILLNSTFLSRFVVDMKCLDHSAIKIKQKKTSFIFKLWCIDQNDCQERGNNKKIKHV